MRRSLLFCLAFSLLAAAPARADHLPLYGPTCGAAGDVALETAGPSSANFRTDGSGAVSAADANTLLEQVRARLVGEFAWPAPPVHASLGKYYARFGSAAQSGVQTTGTYTGQVGTDADRRITCIVLPDNANLAALKPFVARELSKAVWYGQGALAGATAAPAWLRESAAELMEDEVFPDDTPDQLPPDWDQPLTTYPAGATAWLVLRGITERFGTGVAGGAEDAVQATFDAHAGTATGLAGLAAGVASKGIAVETAFNDYAIAARFMECVAGQPRPCFADAAAYGADRPPLEPEIDTATAFEGSVPGGLAARWVDLPTAPHDVKLEGERVLGTIACPDGQAIRLGAAVTRNVSCTDPVLVLTSAAAAQDATFKVTFSAPTVRLTVQRFGDGLVGSAPAGIDCGTQCDAIFPRGTTVTLGAKPAAGSTFAGWAGACTGTAACTITLDTDQTVAAGFAKPGAPGGTPLPPTGGGSAATDDVTAPKVLVGRPRFTKGARKLRVELTCPAAEATSCTGPIDVVLRFGRTKVLYEGEASIVSLAPGTSKVRSFSLSPKTRKALRRHRRAKVSVSVRARDEAFNTLTVKRTFKKVKVPR